MIVLRCPRCESLMINMRSRIQQLKIKFIAKLGAMGKYQDGEEKFHIIIPRKYIDEIRELKGTHIRVVMDNEI